MYIKKGKAILPFKWLAIECISDNVFNTESDVWAYGILLWKLFSLGMLPYPGIEANLQLYQILREGYRMEQPKFANRDIYTIMLSCSAHVPQSRPSFEDLRRQFYSMLPDEVLSHFAKLNEPYVAMNAENMKQDESQSVGSIEQSQQLSLPVSHYVNIAAQPISSLSDRNPDHLLRREMLENREETDRDSSIQNHADLEQLDLNVFNNPSYFQMNSLNENV